MAFAMLRGADNLSLLAGGRAGFQGLAARIVRSARWHVNRSLFLSAKRCARMKVPSPDDEASFRAHGNQYRIPNVYLPEGSFPMKVIPADPRFDSTLALYREGYLFLSNARKRLESDIVSCRLLYLNPVCMGGPDAARLFFDARHFRRRNVAPSRIRKTLLGEGGIHGLDGEPHRHRKAFYLDIMGPHRLGPFIAIMETHWKRAVAEWPLRQQIKLFEEAQTILCGAVCAWAGIPLAKEEVAQRAGDLTALVDAFGGTGWRNWRGRLARWRSEKWMRDILQDVRTGKLAADPALPLHAIAHHRDERGLPLAIKVAAVELLNVIRPMMAAAYFIELAAAAMALRPSLKENILADGEYADCFVQEVRRFCAFTPFLGAESCQEILWQGYRIPKETLVLLDVYGIHHDNRIWDNPHLFDPDRFRYRRDHAFDLIPQGGGDHATGHRCAGEWLTVETIKIAARQLAGLSWDASVSNLSFRLDRIPARLANEVTLTVSPRTRAITMGKTDKAAANQGKSLGEHGGHNAACS